MLVIVASEKKRYKTLEKKNEFIFLYYFSVDMVQFYISKNQPLSDKTENV